MEKLTKNNQLSNKEFKLFCINHQLQNKQSQKKIDFLEFTSFILNTAIHNEEDMGFLLNEDYQQGNFDNCRYSFDGENDCWTRLFELTECSEKEFEDKFLSLKWEDNENTAIIKLANGKEYSILRM